MTGLLLRIVGTLGLSLALLLGMGGLAVAQDTPAPAPEAAPAATVGLYAPSLPFGDSLARARYAEMLAKSLESAIGQTVRGRAFATAGEFQSQVAAGALDFAVVDASFAFEHGNLKPLAQAVSGGNPARALVVATGAGGANVSALAGQSFVLFDVGPSEDRFVANFIFQGQIAADYFKRGKSVRDAQAAVSSVKLGKAQVTLTYEGATGGLASVFTSRPAPLPIFVQARDAVEPSLLAAVKKAAVGLPAGTDVFDSFGGYNPNGAANSGLRSALSQAPGGNQIEPVFAPSGTMLPPVPSYLEAAVPASAVVEPTMVDALTVPPAPGDTM